MLCPTTWTGELCSLLMLIKNSSKWFAPFYLLFLVDYDSYFRDCRDANRRQTNLFIGNVK